jgi:hypothetical protein
MTDILVHRFERYFKHPDPDHPVLAVGDRAPACRNIRAAIRLLGCKSPTSNNDPRSEPGAGLFDEGLSHAVREFQRKFRHRVDDGLVGPGTRRLLVTVLVEKFSPEIFLRLPEQDAQRSVFLSYARPDSDKVDSIEQWLRSKRVAVIRDLWVFEAGVEIAENARKAIAAADKVLAMLSANSKTRNWPLMEWAFAEEVERHINKPVLVYVCLDETPLPDHHRERLAIPFGIPLQVIGQKILHALGGGRLGT